jgi:hypothetical protein
MAEHRRVEPRQIAGTGMATDPERIQQVVDDAERHTRAWRPAPGVGFGDVLDRTPARSELADATSGPRRSGQPSTGTDTDTDTDADGREAAPSAPPAGPKPPARPRLPNRPSPRAPDPRARVLHARLDDAAEARPETSAKPPPRSGA